MVSSAWCRRAALFFIALVSAWGTVLIAPSVCAQNDATGESAALAQRNRGLSLMRAGDYTGAAQAFEQSLSIVESPNTRLDLGRAYLALGRLASALRELERARDTARARIDAGQMQYVRTERAAASEAEALRPRVPTLSLQFSRPPPAGTEVVIASARLPAAAIIAPVPVDPGPVRVDLVGPAVRAHSVERTLHEGERASVDVPIEPVGYLRIAISPRVRGIEVELDGRPLAPERVGEDEMVSPGTHWIEVRAPGAAPLRARREVAMGQHALIEVRLGGEDLTRRGRTAAGGPMLALGITTGIVGLASIGTGCALWFVSDAEYNALTSACGGGPCPRADLVARANAAQGLESAGIALMISGGVALATGVVLMVVSQTRAEHVRVAPALSLRSLGLLVHF